MGDHEGGLTLSNRKMFVRVNKLDGTPDDNGGKGGWWTVQPGVPDEGRPGRKAKSKRPRDGEDGDDLDLAYCGGGEGREMLGGMMGGGDVMGWA